MKWLGQHIWDFISRFRTTVYLENLETSSETNVLVVDSDGKVTKNSSASGDITGVTITTDSGGGSAASDTSGSADFSILGSSGVGVTNSGTTITAVAVPAEIDHDSLSNFASNEHFTQANIVATGTIASGTWEGTAVADSYVANDLTISGGTVNNSIIGGSTPAAITGTTIDATTDFTIGTTIIRDDSIVMTPSTSDTVTIAAATNGTLNITTVDDNAHAADITITADGDAEVAADVITLDSAGDIELEVGATTNYINAGGIFRGGNIGVISDLFIPILWNDFMISNSYRFPGATPLGGLGFQAGGTGVNYYAIKLIPNGYTATSCIIYGVDADEDSTIRCYSSSIDSATVTALAAAVAFDNATSPHSVTFDFGLNDIVGNGLKTCQIEYNPADAVDRILGGKIIIEKTT